LIFVVGCVLFLSYLWSEYGIIGAWCFIIGSAGFTLGSTLSMLLTCGDLSSLPDKLAHGIGVCYFVGSILFEFGSVIYLYSGNGCDQACRFNVFTYAAAEFLVGSSFYFFGSFLNFAIIVLDFQQPPQEESCAPSRAESSVTSAKTSFDNSFSSSSSGSNPNEKSVSPSPSNSEFEFEDVEV